MKLKRKLEGGQALILIVLVITGLVAITGLAVDGGYALSERRNAQNAADASALAASLARIKSLEGGSTTETILANINSAALARAASNGYADSDPGAGFSDPNVNVEVHNPPISGPYSDCTSVAYQCEDYIQVIITKTDPTYFARVVGIQTISNRVEATALSIGPDQGPLFGGNGIVSLNPSSSACDGDFSVAGNTIVNVTGGGVWVNSDNADCAFKMVQCTDGGLNVIPPGGISIVGDPGYDISGCNENIIDVISSGVQAYPYPPEYVPKEPPECKDPGNIKIDYPVAGTTTLTPGWYDQIPPKKSGTIVMEPGNYCVNNVLKSTTPNNTLTGNGVFIYIRKGGDFSMQGGQVNLSAPTSGDYQGYLIYVAPDYTKNPPQCTINGGTYDTFVGAIYAPYCDIIINGDSGFSGLQSQIIGYTVYLGGGATINVTYNQSQNPTGYRPPYLGLMR